MRKLRVVVCVKIVPKAEEVRVDPVTRRLDRAGARSEINPPDMNALECALALKDRYPAEVFVLSMGPPFIEPYVRLTLALGVDHVYLLSDRKFAGSDTLATTYALARAIETIGDIDVVLCGEESYDGSTGQVPPGLAEWLDFTQLCMVHAVEYDPDHEVFIGVRRYQGVEEVMEARLPVVVSVRVQVNEPRFLDYRLRSRMEDPERLTVWSAADIGAEDAFLGTQGSPTIVSGLAPAETRERRRELIKGRPDELARRLADLLARQGWA